MMKQIYIQDAQLAQKKGLNDTAATLLLCLSICGMDNELFYVKSIRFYVKRMSDNDARAVIVMVDLKFKTRLLCF